jgi:hypothetical protein
MMRKPEFRHGVQPNYPGKKKQENIDFANFGVTL